MAMAPHSIRRMLQTAQRLRAYEPEAGFLIAWAAWEAYLQRVGVVALQYQGLSQRDAVSVLAARNFHVSAEREKLLRTLLGAHPSNMRGYGATWNRLYAVPQKDRATGRRSRSYEIRRHELVHGARTVQPSKLRVGIDVVSDAIAMPMFAHRNVRVVSGSAVGSSVPLGDPLQPRRGSLGSRLGTGAVEEVLDALSFE